MQKLFADLMYQALVQLLGQMLSRVGEWLAAVPWL